MSAFNISIKGFGLMVNDSIEATMRAAVDTLKRSGHDVSEATVQYTGEDKVVDLRAMPAAPEVVAQAPAAEQPQPSNASEAGAPAPAGSTETAAATNDAEGSSAAAEPAAPSTDSAPLAAAGTSDAPPAAGEEQPKELDAGLAAPGA